MNCPKTIFTYFIIQSHYYSSHYLLRLSILYTYFILYLFFIAQLKELAVPHFTMIIPCIIISDK